MDAQRVEVLHVADSDAVVIAVAHHLILDLLPTLQALLYKHLRRERECFLSKLVEFFFVVAESATQSTESISSTENDRIAQLGSCLASLLYGLTSLTLDGLYIYLVELLYEKLTVFGVYNSLYGSTKYLYIIFLKHATLVEFHTTVECCLSTESEQDAVRALFLDDTLYEIRLHRQVVDLVCYTLRSLHGSNVRIDKHCLHSLLTQCFKSLRTGIIKLTGLTDFQGTRTKQEDFLYIFVFHILSFNNLTTLLLQCLNELVKHKLCVDRSRTCLGMELAGEPWLGLVTYAFV